jgi:hypothetical protein
LDKLQTNTRLKMDQFDHQMDRVKYCYVVTH